MEGERFNLEFENVSYEVVNSSRGSSTGKYLQLINGVSGCFESGYVTAIMGPSGSCKTSFLDFITGRIKGDSLTGGVVRFRGKPRDQKEWLVQHCYLEQDDCIVPKQTVYEYILFSVSCRRQDLSEKEMNHRIEEVMEKLHISHITNVGLSSLSGGERKRVMIAVEFTVGADVLILDEPTSGLDSHLSLELVHMLKTYAAENNKIVIMTIHQPGSGLFEMIDFLYFFYKGCIIYNGPIPKLEAFLDSKGILVSTSLSKPELLFELFTDYSIIKEVRDCKPKVLELIEEKKAGAANKNISVGSGSGMNFLNLDLNLGHFLLLYKRGAVLSLRGMGAFSTFIVFVSALIYGWLSIAFFLFIPFFSLTESGVIPKEGFGFTTALNSFMDIVETHCPKVSSIWTSAIAFSTVSTVCFIMGLFMSSTIFSDKAHVTRESHKGTYSMTTFFFAMLFLELTFSFILAALVLFMLFCCRLKRVYTIPSIFIYTYVGCFFPKIFSLFFEVLFSGGVLVTTLIGFLKVVVCSTLNLPLVIMISNLISDTGFAYFAVLKYPYMMVSVNFWKEFFYGNLYEKELKAINKELETLGSSLKPETRILYKFLTNPGNLLGSVRGGEYMNKTIRSWFLGITYDNWVNLVFAFGVGLLTLVATVLVLNWKLSPSLRLKHS